MRGLILYDKDERVVGYVEIRNREELLTCVKVIHNYEARGLFLSIHEGGNFHMLEVVRNNQEFELPGEVDLGREVFASLVRKSGEDIFPLASGIINADKPFEVPLTEVDSLLKNLWEMPEEEAEKFSGCLYHFA